MERKVINGHVIANHLVEAPIIDHQPLNIEFLDESILLITHESWTMFFDGSYTHQGLGVKILLITLQRYSLPKVYKMMFPCTNIIVEYEALINGMKMAIKWRVDEFEIFEDL